MNEMQKLAGKKPKPYVAQTPERRTFNGLEAAAVFGVSVPVWNVLVRKYEEENKRTLSIKFKLRGEKPRRRYSLASIDELVRWLDSKR